MITLSKGQKDKIETVLCSLVAIASKYKSPLHSDVDKAVFAGTEIIIATVQGTPVPWKTGKLVDDIFKGRKTG